MQALDPHQRPPDSVRDVYKKYQRMKPKDLDGDLGIVHLERDLHRHGLSQAQRSKVSIVGQLESARLTAAFRSFASGASDSVDYESLDSPVPIYEHGDMPGKIYQSVLFLISLNFLGHSLHDIY